MVAHRTKDTRRVVDAVYEAGGTVEITRRGHLRIIGPAGIAVVGSSWKPSQIKTMLRTVRNYAGLELSLR